MSPLQSWSTSTLSNSAFISCKKSRLKLLTGSLFSSRIAIFPCFSTFTSADMHLNWRPKLPTTKVSESSIKRYCNIKITVEMVLTVTLWPPCWCVKTTDLSLATYSECLSTTCRDYCVLYWVGLTSKRQRRKLVGGSGGNLHQKILKSWRSEMLLSAFSVRYQKNKRGSTVETVLKFLFFAWNWGGGGGGERRAAQAIVHCSIVICASRDWL